MRGLMALRTLLRSAIGHRAPCVLILAGGLLTIAGATVVPTTAVASEPEPITAQLQQPGEEPGDIVRVDGRVVHASPGYFYVQGQATTLAYTLDARRPPLTSITVWHAVPLSTAGLDGVATALWTINAHLPGVALPGDLEGAARQIAIWAKAGTLVIAPDTVPEAVLRRRALLLTRAAPNSYPPNNQPTALALSAFVQHALGDEVNVVVNVADSMEDTFTEPQRIDLRINGRWTTVATRGRFDVDPAQRGARLGSHRSGSAPDNNTAIARILHVTGVNELELFWNVSLEPGIAMMPSGDAPAIMTSTAVKLVLPDTLDVGTAVAASSSPASWLVGLGAGWLSALLAALGLWTTSRRKPTLRGGWNTYDQGLEVAEVTVVAGRRPIELHEIGLVFSWGPPWKRERYHLEGPTPRTLPVRLQDGASTETQFEAEMTIERLQFEIGDQARLISVARPYVRASGKEFRGHIVANGALVRLRSIVRSLRRANDVRHH